MTALVEACGLVKAYGAGGQRVLALQGVDLRVAAGEIVGLVGESGCGKSTLGRCLLRLERPDAGAVRFDGTELAALSGRALRVWRRQAQMVFQDPTASLSPRLTVAAIVTEPLVVQRMVRGRAERARAAARLLEDVHLPPELGARFPHELSGGQRQRVGIARALATRPRFIVADEPLSALDLSVQARILDLLLALHQTHALSYLMIGHDVRLLLGFCHRVAVMYLGRIVEEGPADALTAGPLHPYTRALLWASPSLAEATAGSPAAAPLAGDVPTAGAPPPGCPFHPRCPLYAARPDRRCVEVLPPLERRREGHTVSCHLAEGAAPTGPLAATRWPPVDPEPDNG